MRIFAAEEGITMQHAYETALKLLFEKHGRKLILE